MIEYHVTAKGIVQGVCFRSLVKNLADTYHLYGWVKNLDDGSVLICIQSEEKTLHQFLDELRKNPGRALIKEFIIEEKNGSLHFDHFEILK